MNYLEARRLSGAPGVSGPEDANRPVDCVRGPDEASRPVDCVSGPEDAKRPVGGDKGPGIARFTRGVDGIKLGAPANGRPLIVLTVFKFPCCSSSDI